MNNSAIRIAALVAAAQVAFTGAAAAEPTILAARCTQDGDSVAASIRYSEEGGRTLDYQLSVRGDEGSTSLHDAAGREVASAIANADGSSNVTLGSSWTQQTFYNLVSVLDDQDVQDELSSCAAPAAALPYNPWPWFCPILVFVWDEDLIKHLCRFAY